MNIINNPVEDYVQISWAIQDNQYYYQDTWLIQKAEWDAMTTEEIETKQIAQYKQWLSYMNNPGA